MRRKREGDADPTWRSRLAGRQLNAGGGGHRRRRQSKQNRATEAYRESPPALLRKCIGSREIKCRANIDGSNLEAAIGARPKICNIADERIRP